MISFSAYLAESKNNGVVAAFGRFSPPTIGHGLLVKKVMDTAKAHNADHVVYLSKTQDKKKNPLDISTKMKWAKKMFPGANITAADEHLRTFIDMAAALNMVYKVLYLVAGSDRVAEYQKLLDKYNGVAYQYDKIVVVSAGERDPDEEGAAGMSASKMRVHAAAGHLSEFKKGLPDHMHNQAQAMMDDVRKGMGI